MCLYCGKWVLKEFQILQDQKKNLYFWHYKRHPLKILQLKNVFYIKFNPPDYRSDCVQMEILNKSFKDTEPCLHALTDCVDLNQRSDSALLKDTEVKRGMMNPVTNDRSTRPSITLTETQQIWLQTPDASSYLRKTILKQVERWKDIRINPLIKGTLHVKLICGTPQTVFHSSLILLK